MTWITGLDLLDAEGLRTDMALRIEGAVLTEIAPRSGQSGVDLSRNGAPALVTPGLIDLQVNGGAGLMLGDCTTSAQILDIAAAHWTTGTAAIVPTLISDRPDSTARIVDLVAEAQQKDQAAGILGLHLEGPHLAVAGAHDPDRLRPMTAADLDLYAEARQRLGFVLITVAPEVVPPAQIRALAEAGITVALGHTACDYDTACAAFDAGAVMATHLYNAMSGLRHREPGLVGATLDRGAAFGLIADGVHVHPAALRIALRSSPSAAVLVSDAMAVAGSRETGFDLAGRRVHRRAGRLELSDGTLAGADLTLVEAIENLACWTGAEIAALAPLAFERPSAILGKGSTRLNAPAPARLLVWRGGRAEARIDGAAISPLLRRETP
jgi:N-acetylglucosamine-6-phosphate deacetylase